MNRSVLPGAAETVRIEEMIVGEEGMMVFVGETTGEVATGEAGIEGAATGEVVTGEAATVEVEELVGTIEDPGKKSPRQECRHELNRR